MALSDVVVTRLAILSTTAAHAAAQKVRARDASNSCSTRLRLGREIEQLKQEAVEWQALLRYSTNPNTPAPRPGKETA